MLAEAVRNTQADNKRLQQAKRDRSVSRQKRCAGGYFIEPLRVAFDLFTLADFSGPGK
jgi:hypothetical protein